MSQCKVAIVGAGRMGSIVAGQLPPDVDKLIIDTDLDKANAVAASCGAEASAELEAVSGADVIALVLPTPAIPTAAERAAKSAKPGAIVLNMATSGVVPASIKEAYPALRFVDAKIIGHANSMKLGAPCLVVVNTEDAAEFERIRRVLPGYTNVVMGDSDLVPRINTIGSTEGIRAAVNCRKLLKEFKLPREWEDVVIYTVCAGTMRSYVEGDLGEFARALAERLESED